MHLLLPPTSDCRRLGHSIQHHAASSRAGKLEFCAVCTLGYERALTTFNGNEDMADLFVRHLRAERG